MRLLALFLFLLLGAVANVGGQLGIVGHASRSNLRAQASIDCTEDPFHPKCSQFVAQSQRRLEDLVLKLRAPGGTKLATDSVSTFRRKYEDTGSWRLRLID
jgi:hypothetical protein